MVEGAESVHNFYTKAAGTVLCRPFAAGANDWFF